MVQLVLGEVGTNYIGKLSSFLKLFSVERIVVTNSLRTYEQAVIPRNFRWKGRIDQRNLAVSSTFRQLRPCLRRSEVWRFGDCQSEVWRLANNIGGLRSHWRSTNARATPT